MERILEIITAITPFSVAALAAVSSVLVAKINRVQKEVTENSSQTAGIKRDMQTNHGSTHLGDAIDRISEKIGILVDNQDELIRVSMETQRKTGVLEARMNVLEQTAAYKKVPTTGVVPTPKPQNKKRSK